MSTAHASTIINLPIADCWAKLRDLTLAHRYVPGIVDTRITTAHREGVGASRNVYRKSGKYLQETVTEWQDGKGFTIRLHKGDKDAPFRNAFFRYELVSEAPDRTRLNTTMGYTAPLGALGPLLDNFLLNRIITGAISDVAAGLKHFYETGTTASKAQLKALRRGA